MKRRAKPFSDDELYQQFLDTLLQKGMDIDTMSEEEIENLNSAHASALNVIAEKSAEQAMKNWKKKAHKELRREKRYKSGFKRRLMREWKDGLFHLDALISLCLSIGNDFNNKHRPKASAENNLVFEVLTRLHGHACVIASEVQILLEEGHSHGALLLWRSLHEITVIALFIMQFGEKVAERYLAHSIIDRYELAKKYNEEFRKNPEYFSGGGFEASNDEDEQLLNNQREQLIKKYGESFKNKYGWAAEALGQDYPKFLEIEDAIDFSMARPFHKMASQSIHINPSAIIKPLGYPEHRNSYDSSGNDIILAGPSFFGLADPGQFIAIDLSIITCALVTLYPSIENTAWIKIIDKIFIETQKTLIRDDIKVKDKDNRITFGGQ